MSTKAFRILHYAPDPTSGARYPVGALAQTDSGVEVFLAPHVPGDECLGGVGRARFFCRIQQRLMKVRDFHRVSGLGAYCELSDPVPLAANVGTDFVKVMVEGWHSSARRLGEIPRIKRKVEGHRWLVAHQIDKVVKRSFRPCEGYGTFLRHAPALPVISQYVPGVESLVLMEPLVLRPQIEDDIRTLAQRLGAYSAALMSLTRPGDAPNVEMFVYALPGVTKQHLEIAERDIQYSTARVVSVADVTQSTTFLNRIRTVAAESNLTN